MVKVSISVQKLKKDLNQVSNKEISRAWKGFGSALFLELGELHKELAWKKGGKPTTSLTGELTLSSEGSWKLLRNKQVLLDAEMASDSEINKVIKGLEKTKIKSIDINDKLTSFSLHLSNNDTLELNKSEYGFFTLQSNEKTYISIENETPYIQEATL